MELLAGKFILQIVNLALVLFFNLSPLLALLAQFDLSPLLFLYVDFLHLLLHGLVVEFIFLLLVEELVPQVLDFLTLSLLFIE